MFLKKQFKLKYSQWETYKNYNEITDAFIFFCSLLFSSRPTFIDSRDLVTLKTTFSKHQVTNVHEILPLSVRNDVNVYGRV